MFLTAPLFAVIRGIGSEDPILLGLLGTERLVFLNLTEPFFFILRLGMRTGKRHVSVRVGPEKTLNATRADPAIEGCDRAAVSRLSLLAGRHAVAQRPRLGGKALRPEEEHYEQKEQNQLSRTETHAHAINLLRPRGPSMIKRRTVDRTLAALTNPQKFNVSITCAGSTSKRGEHD